MALPAVILCAQWLLPVADDASVFNNTSLRKRSKHSSSPPSAHKLPMAWVPRETCSDVVTRSSYISWERWPDSVQCVCSFVRLPLAAGNGLKKILYKVEHWGISSQILYRIQIQIKPVIAAYTRSSTAACFLMYTSSPSHILCKAEVRHVGDRCICQEQVTGHTS